MTEKMKKVHLIRHPFLSHSLAFLRDKNTGTEEFRKHAGIVSKLLIIEAMRSLTVKNKKIYTPLAPTMGKVLVDEVVVVPVLRAGLAMLFALQDFMPDVKVGFVGLERDEETAQARQYYRKLPKIFASHKVFVIDPMLATGGSFDHTISLLKERGARKINLICIVSAPEGLKRVQKNHSEVEIYTAALDRGLNDRKFILPGLGDFGDRYFATT